MPSFPFSRIKNASQRYSRTPDAELIAACLAGNAAAWDALIERYEAFIFSLSVRMGLSQADAQDIFQDVCLLLFDHLGDLRDTTRLAGWLASTTRREVWRLHKRRGASLASEMPEQEWQMEGATLPGKEYSPTLEATIIAAEEQQLVREALQHLSGRCRTLLTLLYCQDPPASYADTAQQLHLPIGSIGPTRARCLQHLEKILIEIGF